MRVMKEEAKNSWKYYGLFYSSTDRVISEEYLITKETGDEDVLCFDFAADKWRSLTGKHRTRDRRPNCKQMVSGLLFCEDSKRNTEGFLPLAGLKYDKKITIWT